MTADTDGDGIVDYFEKNGMYLPNVSLIKTDYQNPDTDGDGLLDGEEIDVNIRADTFKDNIRYFFLYSSYPDKADSDGDGLLDSELVANEWGWEIRDPEPIIHNKFTPFGTEEYFSDLDARVTEYINNALENGHIQEYPDSESQITKDVYTRFMMNDVNSAEFYDEIPFENWDIFCVRFNSTIVVVYYDDLHYFRNKLNRAPSTLEELITLSNDKVSKEWTMCGVFSSRYHMNGLDGEYNLKFVSDCGKYEAVYNLDGELLTEQNDPVNMGTYNYKNYQLDVSSHAKYDVIPYFLHGNTNETPAKLFSSTTSSVDDYRNDIMEMLCEDGDLRISRYEDILAKVYNGEYE